MNTMLLCYCFNLRFISKVLTMVKIEGFIIIIYCKRLFIYASA